MSDPREQQNTQDDQVAEDLTVPQEQADEVSGGISLPYGHPEQTYIPQKP